MPPTPVDDPFNDYPDVGLPGGSASRFLRVDFRDTTDENFTEFESLIEQKTPRLAWARGAICSCQGPNTQKPGVFDPLCTKCRGNGWRYFRPTDYVVNTAALGALDPLQTALLTKANAVLIRGLLTGIGTQPDIFAALGKWAIGSATLTVRPGNFLGYYDRIIQIDQLAPFSEVVTVGETDVLETRYPVQSLNFCASIDDEFTTEELELLDNGVLQFKEGEAPEPGTRISLCYQHHPAWIVLEYLNVNRTSLIKRRKANLQTPEGNVQKLPIRVVIRREYVPLPDAGDE